MSTPEITAILLSVKVAAVAVLASLPAAVAVGYLLATKSFVGKTLIETMVNLPLVLPPVVTGYLLLVGLGRQGVVGRWSEQVFGFSYVFDWKGASIAAAVVAFPLTVRSIRSAFASIDPQHLQAAATLGATPRDRFFSVSLPLARHGIIAGCVLGFARALGEFGATIMIAGNIPGRTQTVPLLIFEQLQTPDGVTASVPVILVAVVIAVAAILVSGHYERRSLGRSR